MNNIIIYHGLNTLAIEQIDVLLQIFNLILLKKLITKNIYELKISLYFNLYSIIGKF